jgi:hypothetical protein
MKILITSYDRFCKVSALDKANADAAVTYEEWSRRREAVIQKLSEKLVFRKYETTPGDFWVGEDWFEVKSLHIVLAEPGLMSKEVVDAAQGLLRAFGSTWIITFGVDMAMGRSDIQLLLENEEVRATAPQFETDEIKHIISRLFKRVEIADR